MKANLAVIHGGAPTAVINASLYGVIKEARASGMVDRVYGAAGGAGGLLKNELIDLGALSEETLEALPGTPASLIGTSRLPLEDGEYRAIVERLLERGIRCLLFNGGNGSMEACGRLARMVEAAAPGSGIRVVGIPKTMDNDLAVTDHAPGFGSAARYLAASVAELSRDLAALPIHVCVLESMGRNAGWLTAAASLAGPGGGRGGPDLVYPPERPFFEEEFLDRAGSLFRSQGGVLVVASEGLRNASGEPIVPPIFQVGRSVYYGDVSAHLAGLVIRRLGIKARSEKPGILGRCSVAHQSPVDREEAILAGREAVRAALSGHSGVMVGFKRLSSTPYRMETFLVPIEEVMLKERKLPEEYLGPDGASIDGSYEAWCRPLLGGPLPRFSGLAT